MKKFPQLCLAACLMQMMTPAFADSVKTVACPLVVENTGLADPAKEVLSGAMVMSQPAGEAMDSAAWPSLVPDSQEPDSQEQDGKSLHSTWRIGGEGPGWRDYLYCAYGEKGHFLLIDVTGFSRCDEVIKASGDYAASCR